MERVSKDHWYTKGNHLSISFMKHYVDIEVSYDNEIVFITRVIDENRKELLFRFKTLEGAISFAENIVSKCRTNDEILTRVGVVVESAYQKDINQKIKDNRIELSEEEVKSEIKKYYKKENVSLEVERELILESNNLILHFYLVEKENNEEKRRVLLTQGDLKNVFENYLDGSSYDLVDFKYIGGVRKVGYFIDEETPYFSGIQLQLKENIKGAYVKQKKESN